MRDQDHLRLIAAWRRRVRDRLEDEDLTYDDLAGRLGCSRAYAHMVVNRDGHEPRLSTMVRVANALGMRIRLEVE